MFIRKNIFQITVLTILIILIGFISCEQPQGPAGAQGEQGPEGPAGPAYPIHKMSTTIETVWEDDSESSYTGFHFDTDEWWNITDSEQHTYYYDILIEFNYDNPNKIKITVGSNSQTDMYKVNANSLQDIVSIPSESDRVNIVTFSTSDDPYYIVIKNKYNRWAKICLMSLYCDYNYYGSDYTNHYYYELYYEYYYYKDTEPDFTLHKHIG